MQDHHDMQHQGGPHDHHQPPSGTLTQPPAHGAGHGQHGGHSDDGDGCSSKCQVEPGFVCQGEPSVCRPEGCGDNTCTSDLPCTDTPDCPTDYFCYLDCCYPPPPG